MKRIIFILFLYCSSTIIASCSTHPKKEINLAIPKAWNVDELETVYYDWLPKEHHCYLIPNKTNHITWEDITLNNNTIDLGKYKLDNSISILTNHDKDFIGYYINILKKDEINKFNSTILPEFESQGYYSYSEIKEQRFYDFNQEKYINIESAQYWILKSNDYLTNIKTANLKKTSDMLNKQNSKPYYNLDFGATLCKLEVRINNFSIFLMNINGQAATELPLNSGIFSSGPQKLEVIAHPLNGELTLRPVANFHYKVKAVDVNTKDWDYITSFDEYKVAVNPKQTSTPLLIHRSEFIAEVPYSISVWDNLNELKNNESLKEQLIAAYNEIIIPAKNGDYKNLIEALEKTEERNATTLYLSNKEKERRLASIFKDMNEGLKIMELPKDVDIKFSGNNKLMRLIRQDDESALALENLDTEEDLILDIWFCIPKNGKITIF